MPNGDAVWHQKVLFGVALLLNHVKKSFKLPNPKFVGLLWEFPPKWKHEITFERYLTKNYKGVRTENRGHGIEWRWHFRSEMPPSDHHIPLRTCSSLTNGSKYTNLGYTSTEYEITVAWQDDYVIFSVGRHLAAETVLPPLRPIEKHASNSRTAGNTAYYHHYYFVIVYKVQ